MRGASAVLFACGLLISLAGCAGRIRYPVRSVLNVPQSVSPGDAWKPILGSAAESQMKVLMKHSCEHSS